MLSGTFYDIRSISPLLHDGSQQLFNAQISLNADHSIYQGHFPGNPVVPGVCQVQMVKELIEKAVDHPLILTDSDNIKFLAMIDPRVNPELECSIQIREVDGSELTAVATIFSGSTLFLKFKGKFEKSEGCL